LQENDLRKALIPFIGVRYQKGDRFYFLPIPLSGVRGGGLFSGFSEKKTRHHELMIPPLVACLLDDLGKE
jgi:hypothetical protein